MNYIKSGIAFCLVLFSLTSCKNDKQTEAKEGGEQSVKVIVDMTVTKDDIFQLFYTDGGTDFGPNHIYVNVPGKAESQEIVFDLPADAYVGNLRLDPGQSDAQGEMKINKMTVDIDGKKFEMTGADFFRFFTPGDYVTADAAKLSFSGKKIDGIYDPFFVGTDALVNELKKLN